MMNKCELCKSTARVYCESDEARLCWSCDAKVHSANFLVARHVRNLLCHSCQSPTSWNGSGEKLGRTISICEPCVVTNCVKFKENVESEGSFDSGTDFNSDGEDEDEVLVEEAVEDSNNQAVPLSSFTSPWSKPGASCSGTQDRADIDINISIKRSFGCGEDLGSKDDADSRCIAGKENSHAQHPSSSSSLRPFKFRKLDLNQTGRPQLGASTGPKIAEPVRRMNRRVDMTAPGSGVEQAYECVEFDLNECPFDN